MARLEQSLKRDYLITIWKLKHAFAPKNRNELLECVRAYNPEFTCTNDSLAKAQKYLKTVLPKEPKIKDVEVASLDLDSILFQKVFAFSKELSAMYGSALDVDLLMKYTKLEANFKRAVDLLKKHGIEFTPEE